MSETENEHTQISPRSLAEWISFSIALFVLSIVIGLVIYSGVTIQDRPPILTVTSQSDIRQVEEQFYLTFEVTNSGGGTVESVQVIAELSIEGKVIETGEVQIDFLSAGEVSLGAFIFTHNPTLGELSVRVASYKLP